MGFRDEADAQRQRAERLEAELAAKDAQLRAKDAELARLRDAGEPEPAPEAADARARTRTEVTSPSLRRRLVALAGSVLALSICGAVVYLMIGGDARLDAGASVVTAGPPIVSRSGTVTDASGPAPVAPGVRCTLDVWLALDAGHDCLVRVRCGAVALYGDDADDDGWNDCRADADGVPSSAHDVGGSSEDGDPVLDLELADGTLGVGDVAGDDAWRVEIALDPG